jgi:hypothetical protein
MGMGFIWVWVLYGYGFYMGMGFKCMGFMGFKICVWVLDTYLVLRRTAPLLRVARACSLPLLRWWSILLLSVCWLSVSVLARKRTHSGWPPWRGLRWQCVCVIVIGVVSVYMVYNCVYYCDTCYIPALTVCVAKQIECSEEAWEVYVYVCIE